MFILGGIFQWGPLIVRNAQGQSGTVPAGSGGYTAIMVIIGIIIIGSGIAGLVAHHP